MSINYNALIEVFHIFGFHFVVTSIKNSPLAAEKVGVIDPKMSHQNRARERRIYLEIVYVCLARKRRKYALSSKEHYWSDVVSEMPTRAHDQMSSAYGAPFVYSKKATNFPWFEYLLVKTTFSRDLSQITKTCTHWLFDKTKPT